MSWFRVDDQFTDSKPVVNMPDRYRNAACGVWMLAGAWSARELTDGYIPGNVWRRLLGGTRAPLTEVLCATDGTYDPLLIANEDGSVQITNWPKWQQTAEQVRRKRDANAAQKRRKRGANESQMIRKRTCKDDANDPQMPTGRYGLTSEDEEMSAADAAGSPRGCPPSVLANPLPIPNPLVVTYGGEVTEGNAQDCNGADAPPPPITKSGKSENGSAPVCAKHPNGPDHDEPCVPCSRVRKYRAALGAVNGLNAPQASTEAEQRRIQRDREDYEKRMAIRRCKVPCDSEGRLDWSANGGTWFDCPHDPALLREVHDATMEHRQAAREAFAAWDHTRKETTNG